MHRKPSRGFIIRSERVCVCMVQRMIKKNQSVLYILLTISKVWRTKSCATLCVHIKYLPMLSHAVCTEYMLPADVVDDDGHSPLDLALINLYAYHDYGQINVALYLMNRGHGGDKNKARLLFKACEHGRMDVVKKLIEEFKVDPTGIKRTIV